MNITIIAVVARNRAIGYHGRLLYNLPDDLHHFKRLTLGHTVIMGRKTYESLPHGALPQRRNLVLSHHPLTLPGCEVYGSLEEALSWCKDEEEVFVIGGAQVYSRVLPLATRLCLTEVDDTPKDADSCFPPYDNWIKVRTDFHPIDDQHAVSFSFVEYVKEGKGGYESQE